VTVDEILNLLEKFLLVAATLGGVWLSKHFENKQDARRNDNENMRWVSAGHLADITEGLKKLGKQMFELGQAFHDVREAIGFGVSLRVRNEDERQIQIGQAIKLYQQADDKYVEALNEVSVFLTQEEDMKFRTFLSATRPWVMAMRLNWDPEYMKNELQDFKKATDTLESLRAELRLLMAPKRILARLSKDA
jgi:hypothetical protein